MAAQPTLLVFLVALVALAGILTMFIRPLASEGPQFIDRVPSYVEQARAGRGPVGQLVQRYNLDEYLQRNQARLRESANGLTNTFSSVRTQLNAYPTPHLDQHPPPYLRLPYT